MIEFFLAAVFQPMDLRALDRAHEAWAKCVISTGTNLAPRSTDAFSLTGAAQRACAREEAAVRTALAGRHPDSSSAELDDLVARSRSRIRGLLWAQPWVRASAICTRQPPLTISVGPADSFVERMDLASSVYQGCHGRWSDQSAANYSGYDDGRLRRSAPGRPAAPGARHFLSLHIQLRGGGVATAWLTWFDTSTHGNFCHFQTSDLSEAGLDERAAACFRALMASTGRGEALERAKGIEPSS